MSRKSGTAIVDRASSSVIGSAVRGQWTSTGGRVRRRPTNAAFRCRRSAGCLESRGVRAAELEHADRRHPGVAESVLEPRVARRAEPLAIRARDRQPLGPGGRPFVQRRVPDGRVILAQLGVERGDERVPRAIETRNSPACECGGSGRVSAEDEPAFAGARTPWSHAG